MTFTQVGQATVDNILLTLDSSLNYLYLNAILYHLERITQNRPS